MNQRQGFLDAVTDNPEDDALWSVFADWLDENGEGPRSELVRLECELERLHPGEDRALDLRRRAEDLLVAHEGEWLGKWADRLVRWRWRRGFLYDVTLQPGAFLRHGGDLLREHPVYRFAFVDDQGEPIPPEAVPDVVASPHLAAVRALDLPAGKETSVYAHPRRSTANSAWAQALARTDHVTRLEELVFANSSSEDDIWLTGADLELLAGAAHLSSLRSLDLSDEAGNVSLDAEAVRILSLASFAGRLERLGLAWCPLGDEGIARLASDAAFASLRSLDLEGCERTTRHTRAFLHSPHLTKLEHLSMALDLRPLAVSPRLAQFRSLTIDNNAGEEPGTDAWVALAGSPHLRLYSLCVVYCGLAQEAWEALLASPGLADLHELRLHGVGPLDWHPLTTAPAGRRLAVVEVDDSGFAGSRTWLREGEGLSRLRELHLSSCKQFTGKLSELIGLPHFGTNLRALGLVWCELSEEDLLGLARCPALGRLQTLRLNWQSLSETALQALAASPHLQRLEKLHLAGSATSQVSAAPFTGPGRLPRLREIAIRSTESVTPPDALRQKFGPRLRLFDP